MAAANDRVRTSLLAFLFTDIVGSTDLKRRLGDVEGAEAIAAHDASFRRCVAHYGGTEQNNPGDGFFATFPVPSAALSCALAFQAALADQQVEARVGIHMGEAVLVPGAETRQKLLGLAVDTAGRVMSLAQPSQILVTRHAFDSARQQVLRGPGGESLVWRAHGLYRLRGIEEPIEIHEAGIEGVAPFTPPPDSEKARRVHGRAAQPRGASRGGRALRRGVIGGGVLVLLGIAVWLAGPGADEDEHGDDRRAAQHALAGCDWAQAAGALGRLVDADAASSEERLAHVRALTALKDPNAERALALLARQLGDNDARVQLARARLAWQVHDDVPAALQHIASASLRDERSIDPLALRVEILHSLKDREATVVLPRDRMDMLRADVQAMLRRDESDPRVLLAHGRLLAEGIGSHPIEDGLPRMLHTLEAAAARLAEAAAADPRWAEPVARSALAHGDVAYAARSLSRADAAVEPQTEALRLAEESIARLDMYPHHRCQGARRAWYLEQRAALQLKVGAFDEAVAGIRAAYDLRKDTSAFRSLADTLRNSGRLEEAIELYLRLTEATQLRAAWFELAYCWQQQGREFERDARWSDARASYLRAVEAYDSGYAGSVDKFVDQAYRGQTLLLLAELPGADRAGLLARAGRDFEEAHEAAPTPPVTEVEHRRSLYLMAAGRLDEARRDLLAAIERDGGATTPATNARYARILVRCAIRHHRDGEAAEAADTLELAVQRVGLVAGMLTSESIGLEMIRAEIALAKAMLAPDPAARGAALASAVRSIEKVDELGADQPAWWRESVWLWRRMAGHLRQASDPAQEAFLGHFLGELAAGAMRISAATYERLAELCAARGDEVGAKRARTHATALRG